MANAITIFRMAASIVLLLCPVFSPAFYAFYIMAGVSDMLDGFVARKTNSSSRFGARLDTIADFVFVVVCLIKLLPILSIPAWLYVWIGIIAFIKAVNIVSGFAVQKTFMAVHSDMNKVTGTLLFLLPLTIPILPLKYSAIVVCAIATFAAIQEGHLIRTGELNGKGGYWRRVAKEWSELNSAEITPEMINCSGCRIPGVKTPYCDFLCPIRQCAMSKQMETCGRCPEMNSCEKLGMITGNNADALRRLKE